MIDPRLGWFAAGAIFGVLCGWPWHPRFSRYSFRRAYHYHGCPKRDKATLAKIGFERKYLLHPPTMAECGGPCWEAQDPRACDCGALWRDLPTTPNPPEQPLTADLIRYWRWQDEQVRQALDEDTNPPPEAP